MQINVGRPKDLEKRQRILTAAKSLFLRYGYHGSSMNQIAQEAGVTKLTVYNHFQDKANLFVCAIVATCEELLSARPLNLQADSNFYQEFVHACELALNITNLPEAIKLERLLVELAAEQNPLAQTFYNACHLRMNALWENFFQQAIELGFIQPEALKNLTLLILSLLFGMRHHEVLLGVREVPTAEERQQIIQYSIEIFMLKYQKKP
ncbi:MULTISPECIES: TetR/AcrR family transcriptional regulator [unclassified Acinetobacter]|uniref:TetR/AcrR family transcriptional regulator n=1 Tax=unclassified Acinetobacter TaxID=196816 RepID=UPI000A33AEC6|nr:MULTISPECIES: TetR/AcrR family transcriptional regulator [unclassified Acinetobacter]MDN5511351.1 TetR/AcrR family transcriptional regulator [Acinetobacter sp.]MDN5523689.1 TetR/AcrR family transcriptional regulator [Acinetobacter sp.]OTG58361.1 TetR family transcriptional regulator [Acinetobacter sp. ANC 3903]